MKKLLLFCAFFMLYSQARPQYTYVDGTNFETNTHFVRINNSNPGNLWQVGAPSKVIFNNALSLPNAIVTDLLNPYSANNHSSFHVAVKSPWWFYGSPSVLSFDHKYDTDTLQDGGYIDVSYDGGQTWLDIIHDSTMFNCSWTPGFYINAYNFYGDNDTLTGGKKGFSGRSNGWVHSEFTWMYCIGVDNLPDSMMIRFNFISDSIDTGKEGWMIDNIQLHSSACSGIPESSGSGEKTLVFPNPVSAGDLSVRILHYDGSEYSYTICDQAGNIVLSEPDRTGPEIKVNTANLAKGLYFFRIIPTNSPPMNGKFMKL